MVSPKSIDEYLDRKVEEYMTKDLITVAPSDTVEYLVELFMEYEFNGVPVVKDGILKGICLEIDLLDVFFIRADSFRSIDELERIASIMKPSREVKNLMRKHPTVVYPKDTLSDVARIISKHNILSIPVVEKDKSIIKGIITLTDLRTAIYNSLSSEND